MMRRLSNARPAAGPDRTGSVVVLVLLALGFGSGFLAAGPAGAVSTETWTVNGREGFLGCDLESLSVSSEGVVSLAPAFDDVAGLDAAYVWCLQAMPDGSLRAGTGNDGVVYTIAGDQARSLHEGVAPQVESLARGPDGTLYAGTAPDATILAIAADGTARTFVDLPEHHVWGLAFDASGNLLASTGDRGRLYRIDRAGNPAIVYEAASDHFTSLAIRGGDILVGAESGGLLYAVAPDGKVSVLMDAAEAEVKSLAVAPDGTVFAAVNPGPQEDPGGAGGKPREARPGLYRIRPDGVVEPIWNSPDPNIQAILPAPDGALFVATGGDVGAIYRVDPVSLSWALLARPGPPQVLCLGLAGGILYAGTGSPGKVFAAALRGSPKGVLLSDVQDAKQVADWGVLRWEDPDGAGGGEITFRTRSGNSEKPDPTWSNWSAPLTDPRGSPIPSPPARFIQWEGTLQRSGDKSPALRRVTVAFAEKNLAPVVKSLDIVPGGVTLARGGDGAGPQPVVQNLPGNVRVEIGIPTAGSRGPATDDEAAWARRYRVIRWEASDPNEDPLVFKLECRARGETAWRPIKDDLKDAFYVLDSTQLPDGRYTLRVTASDASQNSPDEARTASRESDVFAIDNTSPVVERITARFEGGKLRVTARLKDAVGPLKRAEISIDGGEWMALHPVDRVMDEEEEEIAADFDVGGDGEHRVLLRASDETGNLGLGRATAFKETR